MYYYLIAPTVVIRANEHAFTYHCDTLLPVGSLVRVSIGKRVVNGVVFNQVKTKPSFATKPILEVLTPHPLPTPLIGLAKWLSAYYAAHMAMVLQSILPAGLHKQRRETKNIFSHPIRKRVKIVLNEQQKAVINKIAAQKSGTVLLHGVTGAGKTQVYIEAAKHQASIGKSSIILVPEIALTPQLVAEFKNHFTNLAVTHSGMTEAARHKVWLQVLAHQDEPLIIIGPRSALFMPVKHLGLIVVDESHEPSYKQEQSPRYSALRAASVLGKLHKATVVLGSASPSIQDYYLAQTLGNNILHLPHAAKPVTPPQVEIVDFKSRQQFSKHRFLSTALLNAMTDTLAEGRQALIFHNRRGTAPSTMCEECSWTADCPVCFMPLTLHADHHILRCHLCNYSNRVPASCPQCGQPTIIFKGIGTKLIQDELARFFPNATIGRFDADTETEGALHTRYQELYDGSLHIMIGTQVLAKGLDLPHLGMVGVIQADSGLTLPDYQSHERVYQLLYQVIGRAGRNEKPSKVIIQTFQPEHIVIQQAVARDYSAFYKHEIARRKQQGFPPFCFLLKLTCSYKTEAGAINASKKLAGQLRAISGITILGPSPSFYERLGGNYRWQIIVKSTKRDVLAHIAANAPKGWQADIDPASLL